MEWHVFCLKIYIMKEIIVDKAQANQRLDKYLKRVFREAGSGFLYKMLRKKNIVLNDKKASGSEILGEGDVIKVFFSDETFDKMRGAGKRLGDDDVFDRIRSLDHSGLSILYEDDDIIAAVKPFGLLSMPDGEGSENINDMILARLISEGKLTLESYRIFHPSVANRLDRNTGGIILFGKTLKGSGYLTQMIRDGLLIKTYVCVCHGIVEREEILTGFWTKGADNTVSITPFERDGAKQVKTGIRPIAFKEGNTLLEVRLYTGRTHQIRAHLSGIGHPILGDPKYGRGKKDGFDHQLLFCHRVRLGDLDLEAPLPSCFDEFR